MDRRRFLLTSRAGAIPTPLAAEGKRERLPELAARLHVDVLVARALRPLRAAQQATRTIPIVMSTAADPVLEGLVASLAQPGGNVTGLSLRVQGLAGKTAKALGLTIPPLLLPRADQVIQ